MALALKESDCTCLIGLATTLRDPQCPLHQRLGLCGNKEDHSPHNHLSATLGYFWCHADQSKRLPHAAEIRRRESK